MVEFSEGKFILCRELFLTKSSVNRTERSIPFCDRGVFRMFISGPASCTYNKVYFIVIKSAFSSDSYFADFSYTCESAFSSDSCFADFSYTCESAFSSDSCFADFSYACKSAFSSDSCFADFSYTCESAFLSDSCFADFFLHLHIRTCMILCYNKVYFFTA